jgi:hypothetical protein
MARHALEHLATTDHGVVMLRNLVRLGIRTVQAGKDPKGICRKPGIVIPTNCNDTVIRVPPAPDAESDRRIVRETGRRVAEERIKNQTEKLL